METNNKDILLSALGNLSGSKPEASGGSSLGKVINQLNHITGYLKHLENGVMGLAAQVQRSALTERMIVSLMIEKGLLTEEEANKKYQEEVINPIMQANKEVEKKIAEITQQQQEKEQEKEEDYSGDVILASERFRKQEE